MDNNLDNRDVVAAHPSEALALQCRRLRGDSDGGARLILVRRDIGGGRSGGKWGVGGLGVRTKSGDKPQPDF